MTEFWKTGHLRIRTEIPLLPVHDRYVHLCNIQKHQEFYHTYVYCQVCYYRRLLTDAVKPSVEWYQQTKIASWYSGTVTVL